MKDGRFEIGDMIKGINERRYLITNKNMTRGEVISLYKEKGIQKMRIMIKETTNGENCDSKTYGVENSTMYFELIGKKKKKKKKTSGKIWKCYRRVYGNFKQSIGRIYKCKLCI